MAFSSTDYTDANEAGVGWGPIDYSGGYQGDGFDVPAGTNPDLGTYPNSGPVPTYAGQGGVQVGGTLNVNLGGGKQISVSGGSGPNVSPAPPGYYPSYNRQGSYGIFQGSALLWLILIVAAAYVILR